jgi:hypothetical protein
MSISEFCLSKSKGYGSFFQQESFVPYCQGLLYFQSLKIHQKENLGQDQHFQMRQISAIFPKKIVLQHQQRILILFFK